MPDPTLPHIAGNPATLTPRQTELVDLAASARTRELRAARRTLGPRGQLPVRQLRGLARRRLAGRSACPRPTVAWAPTSRTYALVAAELGRLLRRHGAVVQHARLLDACGRVCIADALDMTPGAARRPRAPPRAFTSSASSSEGKVYSQPFSEGGAAAAGKAPFGTLAAQGRRRLPRQRPARSLPRCPARPTSTACCAREDKARRPRMRDALYLAVPADAPGVSGQRRLGSAGHARHRQPHTCCSTTCSCPTTRG